MAEGDLIGGDDYERRLNNRGRMQLSRARRKKGEKAPSPGRPRKIKEKRETTAEERKKNNKKRRYYRRKERWREQQAQLKEVPENALRRKSKKNRKYVGRPPIGSLDEMHEVPKETTRRSSHGKMVCSSCKQLFRNLFTLDEGTPNERRVCNGCYRGREEIIKEVEALIAELEMRAIFGKKRKNA